MDFQSVSEAREEAGSAAMESREESRERRSTSRDSGVAHQLGIEPYRDGHETVLQRLAQQHGAGQVRQWAAEGMPIEMMGKTLDMEDFRERRAERPPEVPTDIERQNARSVQRSKGAHHESSFGGETQVPDSVRSVISSSGQQLDPSIQRAMEERMGDSLGDVRIHTGPQAANACDDINARAFTVGNHIAFNRGEYDPSSKEGQHVLAHELAHVRQQTGGAVSMLPQEGELAIDPDERLEREAEETAQRVMRGGMLGIQRLRRSEVHVQRAPKQTGFGDDGSVSVENVNEDALPESMADDSEVNFAHVLRVLGKTGAISAIGGALAKGGAVLAGVTDPAAAQALLTLASTGTTVTAGWAALYNEIDPQVVRTTFEKAGKGDLLDTILERLGDDVETGSDEDPYQRN